MYCHPQTHCFVVSQLFSVARPVHACVRACLCLCVFLHLCVRLYVLVNNQLVLQTNFLDQ